eukprot:732627-Pyramimonas_sp.AAC.1
MHAFPEATSKENPMQQLCFHVSMQKLAKLATSLTQAIYLQMHRRVSRLSNITNGYNLLAT